MFIKYNTLFKIYDIKGLTYRYGHSAGKPKSASKLENVVCILHLGIWERKHTLSRDWSDA